MVVKSDFGDNLLFRFHKALGHLGADRGFISQRAEIAGHLAVDVLVAGFLEISFDDFLSVNGSFICRFAHQFGGPEAQKLVGACLGFELHFCVMGEFIFKGVFAFIKRAHGGTLVICSVVIVDMPSQVLARKGGMHYDAAMMHPGAGSAKAEGSDMARRKKLYEGKAKVLYEGPEPGTLVQYFKDDATAFNAQKKDVIEGKGVLNNRLSEYFMTGLTQIGIPNHFIKRLNMREQLIRQVEIVPLEVIVRNFAAGTMAKRMGMEEGTPLPRPIVEFSYKDDALGDPLVPEEYIIAFGWASQQELDDIVSMALRVNDWMSGVMYGVGIKLIDFKIEIGRVWDGEFPRLIVADEISPDSCRLWDIETGRKLDKDVFRRDLGSLADAYTEVARRLGVMPSNVTHAPSKPTLIN